MDQVTGICTGIWLFLFFISSVLKSLENKAESWSREPTGNLFSFQSASNFERKIRSPAKTKTQHQL